MRFVATDTPTHPDSGRASHATRRCRATPWWQLAIVAILPAALGLALFSSAGTDDPYITYWASKVLAETGEIVNYNGDRVEQSSSLAHVLLLAALARVLPLPLPTLGPLVSLAFSIATVAITMRLAAMLKSNMTLPAGLLVASSACLIYWSTGALEATISAFLCVCLVLAYEACLNSGFGWTRLCIASAVTVCFNLARPESGFVALSALFGTLGLALLNKGRTGRRTEVRRCLLLLGITGAVMLAIGTWRLSYFGDIFPQPVTAKAAAPTLDSAKQGLHYLLREPWARYDAFLILLAIPGIALIIVHAIRSPVRRPYESLLVSFLVAHSCFIVFSGGDWMPAGRFLVPMLPATVLVALTLLRHIVRPNALAAVVAALVCLQLLATVQLARHESLGSPLWSRLTAREAVKRSDSWFERANRVAIRQIPLAERLDALIQELLPVTSPLTILSAQMGLIPYRVASEHYGQIRVIDRLGLVTRDFTNCPITAPLSRSSIGLSLGYDRYFAIRHELGEYGALGRPHIIVDLGGSGGYSEHLSALCRDAGYELVYEQRGPVAHSSRWLRGRDLWFDAFIAVRGDLIRGTGTAGLDGSLPGKDN